MEGEILGLVLMKKRAVGNMKIKRNEERRAVGGCIEGGLRFWEEISERIEEKIKGERELRATVFKEKEERKITKKTKRKKERKKVAKLGGGEKKKKHSWRARREEEGGCC